MAAGLSGSKGAVLIRWLWHLIAHLTGWNYGHVVTWHEGDKLMVGFKCDGCGFVEHEHECTWLVDKWIRTEIGKP